MAPTLVPPGWVGVVGEVHEGRLAASSVSRLHSRLSNGENEVDACDAPESELRWCDSEGPSGAADDANSSGAASCSGSVSTPSSVELCVLLEKSGGTRWAPAPPRCVSASSLRSACSAIELGRRRCDASASGVDAGGAPVRCCRTRSSSR